MIGTVDIFYHQEDPLEVHLCKGDIGEETHYWVSFYFPEITVCFHLEGERGRREFLEKIKQAIESPPEVR